MASKKERKRKKAFRVFHGKQKRVKEKEYGTVILGDDRGGEAVSIPPIDLSDAGFKYTPQQAYDFMSEYHAAGSSLVTTNQEAGTVDIAPINEAIENRVEIPYGTRELTFDGIEDFLANNDRRKGRYEWEGKEEWTYLPEYIHPLRATETARNLVEIDGRNEGRIQRILAAEPSHTKAARIISALGYHTNESTVRRYRKKIGA